MKEIVVTATRVDSTVLESPSSISVISAQQIADSGATDVAQVISGQPGVTVNDYGATGALKNVSLRGSTSSQVLVLLDGVRLNSSRDGAVDLSSIPMEIIDHIEIVRGGESAFYGSSAIGGVINIITRKAEKPEITLTVTNGSYLPHDASILSPSLTTHPASANLSDLVDSQNVELSVAGKAGDVGLTAGGSFTRAANEFTWDDAAVIKGWRRMENADTLSGSGYAGLDAPLLGGTISAKGVLDASDTGAPYIVSFPNATARQTDTAVSGSVGWKTDRFFSDSLTFDLKAFYRYDQLGYDDSAFPPASLHKTHTASLDLTQKLKLTEWAAAIYGGNTSYDAVDSTNFARVQDRLGLSGFLSIPLAPLDFLTITPTARYDYYSNFSGRLSYSLSAVLLLGEDSSLRASFASAYRVPTMNELYWSDPYLVGNLDLKPETSYSGEIGWFFQGKQASMDAALFTRLVFDEISAIWPLDPVTSKYSPVNISRSVLPGADLHGKIALTDTISLEATYTFIYSLLLQYADSTYRLSDNLRVPFVPEHSVSGSLKYADKMISVSAGLQYVSRRFTEFANDQSLSLPGYFLGNADFRLNASETLAFTLALKNIFNTLYYSQPGYPMPPFSIETGVRLHW
jgi:outer membrane cobalamin receptor